MPQSTHCIRIVVIATVISAAIGSVDFTSRLLAQDRRPDGRLANPGLPGWCETPASERKSEIGCYTTGITPLGSLPHTPIFWYLDTFPTHEAAVASRGPRGTVVSGLGKHWLFTIESQGWPKNAGQRVAVIGPLVVQTGAEYTARYLETVIPAGMQKEAAGHRHPGPEAWYVLEGGQCLETPDGARIARAGQTMIAPEGAPMAISSYGPDRRRAVVLVLHRSDEPFAMAAGAKPEAPHAHWKPQGLCQP
jgi:quercetin dioxygenase-like cupin family protein